ncbi:MAG: cold shock domain-containing protein [Candidatus Heimdallarchaeota archaeon]|nr:cold shock domain-containing protein [Candidatus Heimdallarchaeota archaeon]
MKGTIKKLMQQKGFGFIQRKDEEDIYFHWTKTDNDFFYLKVGDSVEFDVVDSKTGPQAVNVTVTDI